MDPKQKAEHIINEFYYLLPNNGSADIGVNSCKSRLNEAIKCAKKNVENIIDALDINKENQFIIGNYWEIVLEEIFEYEKKHPWCQEIINETKKT